MYSITRVAGSVILRLRNTNIIHPPHTPRFLGGCFRFVSKSPSEGGSGDEGVGEKAKQTMDDVLGTAKETGQNLKDRAMGSSGNDEDPAHKPSKNPDLNHGVEPTDSSCEDVRGRPGGYS